MASVVAVGDEGGAGRRMSYFNFHLRDLVLVDDGGGRRNPAGTKVVGSRIEASSRRIDKVHEDVVVADVEEGLEERHDVGGAGVGAAAGQPAGSCRGSSGRSRRNSGGYGKSWRIDRLELDTRSGRHVACACGQEHACLLLGSTALGSGR